MTSGNWFWPASKNRSRGPFLSCDWITGKTRACYTLWIVSRMLAAHQHFERVRQVNVFEAQEPGLTSSGEDTSGFSLACAEDRQPWGVLGHGRSLLHQLSLPPPASGAGHPWAGGAMHLPGKRHRFLLGITESKSGALLLSSAHHCQALLDCCLCMIEDCWIMWLLTTDSTPPPVYPSHEYRDSDE